MFKQKSFVFPKRNESAIIRLVCFAYAGGSAGIYFPWAEQLPEFVELVAVQLPGRAERMGELPHTDISSVISELYGTVPVLFDKPFCFFGHSLGARIITELTLHIQANGGRMPLELFVSGSRAPQVKRSLDEKVLNNLPKLEFIKELRELDGTPQEILESEELMRFVEPMLRADFKLAEEYLFTNKAKVNTNVTIFGGYSDVEITESQLDKWADIFTGSAERCMFNGGHFFIHESKKDVLSCISNKLVNIISEEEMLSHA
jgi:medium-chain acyl-[acyl-carrier-protein] hydrolase